METIISDRAYVGNNTYHYYDRKEGSMGLMLYGGTALIYMVMIFLSLIGHATDFDKYRKEKLEAQIKYTKCLANTIDKLDTKQMKYLKEQVDAVCEVMFPLPPKPEECEGL